MTRFIVGTLLFAVAVGVMSKRAPDVVPAPVAQKFSPESQQTPSSTKGGNGYAETSLERSPDGHFYAELMVNGAPIRFLVDTGATSVALTREDAQKAGLQFSEGEFTGKAQTASGSVGVKPVKLDRMTLGALETTQVDAAIIEQGLNISLLGQSWLRQVGTVTIEGDKMVLR